MAGQENYLYLTQENYYDQFEKNLLDKADKYYLYKNFAVGKQVDNDERMHDQMFYDILCTDSCELIDWVTKKINGKLDQKCKKIGKPFVYDTTCGCHDTKAINESCQWESMQW